MSWDVLFHDDFDAEMQEYVQALQDELLAHAQHLAERQQAGKEHRHGKKT